MIKLEPVFKALADESRRKLLDLLFVEQGRSLSELEEHLPMTRFGVMKHLKVLREAGLVTTRKSGRETLHYLNAVPIQMVYDRWVSKYSKGGARSLTALKYDLEENQMEEANMAEAKPASTNTQVFEVYIKTTPERLWQALTDGELTEKYYFGTRVSSDLRPGSDFNYITPDGDAMVGGTVVEAGPPRRLVTTFMPKWALGQSPDFPETTVTYEIAQMGATCRLTLTHEGLPAENELSKGIFGGWNRILSGLKTLLETGDALQIDPANG